MFKISTIRKTLVHLRKCTKFIILVTISIFFIVGIVASIYKPVYSVTLNGEIIGYSADKSKLQERINEYIEEGNGQNVAFVDINELPQYSLCLLKKDVVPNDEEIYEKVIEQGTQYYKYYAITVDDEEKAYLSSFAEAENVINELKDKNSNNSDQLGVIEKYETALTDFKSEEECVEELYEKKVVVAKSSSTIAASGVNTSSQVVDLGISLIRPVSGIVTSRFGARWGRSHKGTDIGAPAGTPIYAAASGTVIYSEYGYGGGYGNHIIISHGNGITTLYGHCTTLIASEGEYVSQGQLIATVGSTGASTGNHLHLEIRVDGVAQDPQNYLYSE